MGRLLIADLCAGPWNHEWRLAKMPLLNQVAHVWNAPARFAEAAAEIVDIASFGLGSANPALVGYAEAATSGAGRRRFRQLT